MSTGDQQLIQEFGRIRDSEVISSGGKGRYLAVSMSRKSGFDPEDIITFMHYSEAWRAVIISRCPKVIARGLHMLMPAKPFWIKDKTNNKGYVSNGGIDYVSDYDLMTVALRNKDSGRAEKICFSWRDNIEPTKGHLPSGAPRGDFSPLAMTMIDTINKKLHSKIQHGCQDDYHSTHNPGLKHNESFLAFDCGEVKFLSTPVECEAYYTNIGLHWPYSGDQQSRYQFTGVMRYYPIKK